MNNLMMNDCDMYTINNKPYIKYRKYNGLADFETMLFTESYCIENPNDCFESITGPLYDLITNNIIENRDG